MNRGGKSVRAALVGALFAGSALLLGGCGGGGGGGANADEPVRFGMVDWPEAIAKTNVMSTIVDSLGYETEVSEVSVPLVFKGLEQGDLDVFVEAWFPTMQPNLEAVDQEEIISTATNLPDATFSIAVNQEACDEGVTSHEDLDANAERFEESGSPTVYGIEPGNDGNQVVLDAIENDTYGMGDWDLVESSTNGMLGEVERRIEEGQWVAFTGWAPHWMNNEFDMCLLEDPEQIWGGPSRVETLVNSEFPEEFPELLPLFEQMQVNQDIQADLIDMIDNSGLEPEEVALQWLRENPDVTSEWLEGVTATDGTPGPEALQRFLDEQGSA